MGREGVHLWGPTNIASPAVIAVERPATRCEITILLAVIPSGENTRDAPHMQEEAQAQGQMYRQHPRSTLSSGCSGRPTRWELDAGFLRDNGLSAQGWLFKV